MASGCNELHIETRQSGQFDRIKVDVSYPRLENQLFPVPALIKTNCFMAVNPDASLFHYAVAASIHGSLPIKQNNLSGDLAYCSPTIMIQRSSEGSQISARAMYLRALPVSIAAVHHQKCILNQPAARQSGSPINGSQLKRRLQ